MDVAAELAVDAAAIDGVEAAVPLVYSYLVPEGRQEDFFAGVILPLAPDALDEVWRPVIIDGRAPAQGAVDEIVVNQGFVDVTGLGIGDRFVLVDPLDVIRQPMTITGVGVLTTDFTFGAGAPLGYPPRPSRPLGQWHSTSWRRPLARRWWGPRWRSSVGMP